MWTEQNKPSGGFPIEIESQISLLITYSLAKYHQGARISKGHFKLFLGLYKFSTKIEY